MNATLNFRQYMYSTPDDWGNVTVFEDEPGMKLTIKSLADAFDEPFTGTLDDCQKYTFIKMLGNGDAAYQGGYSKGHGYEVVILARTANGWESVDSFYQNDHADELAELGVTL